MDREIELFIQDYLKEIRKDNAATFAGAGLSAPAGFVKQATQVKASAHHFEKLAEKTRDT